MDMKLIEAKLSVQSLLITVLLTDLKLREPAASKAAAKELKSHLPAAAANAELEADLRRWVQLLEGV